MKTSTKIIIGIVVAIVLSVVAYYFWNKKKTKANLTLEKPDPLTEIATQ